MTAITPMILIAAPRHYVTAITPRRLIRLPLITTAAIKIAAEAEC